MITIGLKGQVMEGLKGRKLIPLAPDHTRHLEQQVQQLLDWSTAVTVACPTCNKTITRPRIAHGNPCHECCTHQNSILRGYITKSNGIACAQAMCLTCGKRGDIRKTDLDPVNDICFVDYVSVDDSRACERCGQYGVEEQHWAPKAIFNDADSWPTSYLCPPCHRLWHRAMRAAKGVSLPTDQRIGDSPDAWYAA